LNPVLVALDYVHPEPALAMARATRDHVGGFKVGLRLMMSEGPGVIHEIAALGLPVFADAKLHDIPDQVRDAASRLAAHGARWVTVHATGGEAMIAAAVEGLEAGSNGDSGVLAVTVLTSLDEEDLAAIGLAGPLQVRARELAKLAAAGGAEGFVSSPREVGAIKEAVPGLIAVTPGIRTPEATADDQKRIATPEAALAAGADLLVVGRSITAAPDPVAAAAAIAASL
jgi:orotidine-5'-phosphate decarboxylase